MNNKNLKLLNLEDLLVLYQKDTPEVFSEIYQRLEKRLNAYLLKRLKNKEAREEVLQIIFFKLHELRYRYNPKYLGLQWAYVIARSELKDYLKKMSKHDIALPMDIDNLSQNAPDIPNNRKETISDIMQGLNEADNNLIKLRVFDELRFNEIAEVMGLQEANVRQKFNRLLKKIRGLVK